MYLYPGIYFTLFYSILIISLNFFFFKKISKYLVIENNIANIIFYNHLMFAVIYFFNDIFSLFDLTPGSDALSFYFNTELKIKDEEIRFIPGHNFLYFINYILRKIYFDFLSTNLLFSSLGSLSVLIFYGSVSKYLLSKFDRYIIVIFILLPSYNFWTSGISKDVLIALALSLMLLAFTKNNLKIFFISLVLIFFVRTHISLLILMSYIFSFFLIFIIASYLNLKIYFFNYNLSKKYSIIIFIIFLFAAALIINYFFYENFINLNETIDHFQAMYKGDNFINSTFFPSRFFEYLLSPYFWEHNHIIYKMLSLENILITCILIFFIFNSFVNFKKKFQFKKLDLKFAIMLSFILIAIFQITLTSNAGIALRQKWVFLPGLIFLLVYCKFYFITNKFKKVK